MREWKSGLAAACTSLFLVVGTANAAVITTVNAHYDNTINNSVFVITNTSALSETITLKTSLGPTLSIAPFTIAASSSFTYSFNAVDGGYLTDPAGAGTPNTTQYSVQVAETGVNVTSAAFSPVSTGIDFLGFQCAGFSPCSVPLSGVVATVSTPAVATPEPATFALLAPGLLGLAAIRRRTH